MSRAARPRLPISAFVLLVSLFGACALPPFDPALSAGAALAERLGKPRLVLGPVDLGASLSALARFVPARVPAPDSGFVVDPGGAGLWWLALQTDGTTGAVDLGATVPPTGGNLALATAPVSLGQGAELIFLSGGASLGRITPSPGSWPLLPLATGAAGESIIAAGSSPLAGGGEDRFALLLRDGAGLLGFSTFVWPLASPPLALPVLTTLPDPGGLPGAGSGGTFLAASPAGPFYWGPAASAGGYRWTTAAAAPLALGLSEPLVGLLSDGHLVAQGPLSLALHHADGSLAWSLPAGDVRFAGEIYGGSGGQFVILSELLCAPLEGGSSRITAAIWLLPLADFLALK